MRKFLFIMFFVAALLLLSACDFLEFPDVEPATEQVDPALWSISAEAPSITEDAYHFLYLHGVQDIYLYLGMTREEARNFIPNIGDGSLVSSPQFGAIGFNDDDQIDQIMIFAVRWITPSGIAAGSAWSELEKKIGETYNLSSLDGMFRVNFTRSHTPVLPESEEWKYWSYNVRFTRDDDNDVVGMISIRSRTE